MGILQRVFDRYLVRSFGLRGESPWLIADNASVKTSSGSVVSESNSLSVTAVWACIRIIAWTAASLPLPVYKRLTPRGKVKAPENPVYSLLQNPNPEITAFQWKSLMSVHQNLWGAGISEIEYDRSGNPIALWPLPPWRVTPKRSDSKELYYEVRLDDGTIKKLPPYRCLVFPSLSTSDIDWLSPIAVHRETIGMAQALTTFGAKTFGEGTNPAGIISHPGRLKETSEEGLKRKFSPYQGLGGAHRLMLLEEGMKFERIGLPPEDAQYLETRKFTIGDIARIYSVPLHLLQDHEKSTSWGTGIEEMNLGFLTFTMRPYFVQWEQEINKKLLLNDSVYFAEFLIDAMMRGRISERYAAYATGRQWGWLSVNDIREYENLNPVEDGDIYLQPMNMAKAGEPPPAQVKPEAEPEATAEPEEEEEEEEEEDKEKTE